MVILETLKYQSKLLLYVSDLTAHVFPSQQSVRGTNLVFVRRSRFPRIESNRIDSYTGACHGCSPPEKSPRPERTDASRS